MSKFAKTWRNVQNNASLHIQCRRQFTSIGRYILLRDCQLGHEMHAVNKHGQEWRRICCRSMNVGNWSRHTPQDVQPKWNHLKSICSCGKGESSRLLIVLLSKMKFLGICKLVCYLEIVESRSFIDIQGDLFCNIIWEMELNNYKLTYLKLNCFSPKFFPRNPTKNKPNKLPYCTLHSHK